MEATSKYCEINPITGAKNNNLDYQFFVLICRSYDTTKTGLFQVNYAAGSPLKAGFIGEGGYGKS